MSSCPTARAGLGGSPKTSRRKPLRTRWNYLAGAEGGSQEAGQGCWVFSAASKDSSWFTAHLVLEILLQPSGNRHKPLGR